MTTDHAQAIQSDIEADPNATQAIEAVAGLAETISAITSLRFVCIAHVTCHSRTSCAVLDKLDFGFKAGDVTDFAFGMSGGRTRLQGLTI